MKNLILLLIILPLSCVYSSCGSSDKTDGPSGSFLRLNAYQKVVANQSGSFNVMVSSNTKWSVEPKNTWLHVDRTKGDGNMTVKVSFDENTQEKRSGVVRFSADGLNSVDMIVNQSELTFTNPIAQIPDPWIVKQGDFYYLCKAAGNGLNVSKSDKLSVISGTKQVWNTPFDTGKDKVWNRTNVWAPEMHYVDGKWYIYYAAGRPHAETDSYTYQRSGTLRAKTDDPMGEWEDMGMLYTGDTYTSGITPTLDNTNYAIDLGVFKIGDQLYAIWSGNPKGSGDQYLYIATMSNPYTISSSRVMISKPDQPWELVSGKVNEGPAFLLNKEKGKFFVVYSCNGSWTKDYRLGYLELDINKNPMEPSNWKKSTSAVFTRSDDTANVDGVNGVGHCSFTKSPDNTEDWIIYHVKNRKDGGWESGRSTFMQKFTWNSDGTPNFGTPVSWGETLNVPSGETR